MGASRIAVSRKRCILEIWCIEQKVFVLAQIGHIWSEPARPDPARPDRHAFETLISWKPLILKKKIIRDKLFEIFIKFMYQNFIRIWMIFLKIQTFSWKHNFRHIFPMTWYATNSDTSKQFNAQYSWYTCYRIRCTPIKLRIIATVLRTYAALLDCFLIVPVPVLSSYWHFNWLKQGSLLPSLALVN